jgi:hypothetical protein
MSHWPRHLAGGRFLEPKTLHPDHLRTLSARRKIETIKRLVGSWHDGTWREVAAYLGDERKAGACCRLVTDEDFHPSIALIETIESAVLPLTSDGNPQEKRRESAGSQRVRKHYHRPCMDDAEYVAWQAWKAERKALVGLLLEDFADTAQETTP